jgi:5-methylcytosine-specific restriction endonuclease McrA
VTGRRWQQIRAHVFAVHGERCGRCGAVGVPLEVHHRDHDHTNNAISNLQPLCRSCHAKAGIRAA